MPDIARIKEIAEALPEEWSVSISKFKTNPYCDSLYEACFQAYTPAGEDFFFSVYGETYEEITAEVTAYYEDFDEAEHIHLVEGMRGAPSLSILIADAKAIKKMLKKLSRTLERNGEEAPKPTAIEILTIEGRRDGYHPTQCRDTFTVGDLINLLSEYDEDTPVYLKNDNGYTYGSIDEGSLSTEVISLKN